MSEDRDLSDDPEAVWRSWNDLGPTRHHSPILKSQIDKGIAERRGALGLTQQDLADRMGVPRSQTTAWETGRNSIMSHDLPWIAHHLGLTASQLIEGTVMENSLLARIAALPLRDQELIIRIVEALERRK